MSHNENKNEYGYLYCVSNSSMPGILNIGMTWMAIEARLKDINGTPGLWYPPTVYKCEFAKKVRNVEDKKEAIYKLLAKSRINPIRKFFRISLEDARLLFDLLDGEYWDNGEASAFVDEEANDVDECSNWNIPIIDERFEKRKAEIKATEKKMLDCIFNKSDDLSANLNRIEANLIERRMELKEVNEVIEKRKAELLNLMTSTATTSNIKNPNDITEY